MGGPGGQDGSAWNPCHLNGGNASVHVESSACLAARLVLTGPGDPHGLDGARQATRAQAHRRGRTGCVPQPSLFVRGKLCRDQVPNYSWSPLRLQGAGSAWSRAGGMLRLEDGRARFSVQLQFSPHSSLIMEIHLPIIHFYSRQKEFFA